MGAVFDLAGLTASDYQFMRQVDNALIYDAVQAYMQRVNQDAMMAASAFISEITTKAQERYQLPGAGLMSPRATGTNGPAVRAGGSISVAYPLLDFGEQVAEDDVAMAYMTPDEFERHVETVSNRYMARLRRQILYALLDNQSGAAWTFADRYLGNLSIQPLADGDTVVYPPVLGSYTDATENHYLESGYAYTAISDTNDPFVTIVNELEEHFGEVAGGSNIVVFINNEERTYVEALTDFDAIPDNFIVPGANIDIPQRLPNVPGRIIGRHIGSGCWISQWRWMPAKYMFGVHLEVDAPLKMRVDPPETGLPQGLALVSNTPDYPFESMQWRARFGLGVANRLNGVAFELGTGGTYTVPTNYDGLYS